jgi:hypothetical protein
MAGRFVLHFKIGNAEAQRSQSLATEFLSAISASLRFNFPPSAKL